MLLTSVERTHFRGCRTTTVIPINEAMTGIVGRNDDHSRRLDYSLRGRGFQGR